jgi:hypothetical protein
LYLVFRAILMKNLFSHFFFISRLHIILNMNYGVLLFCLFSFFLRWGMYISEEELCFHNGWIVDADTHISLCKNKNIGLISCIYISYDFFLSLFNKQSRVLNPHPFPWFFFWAICLRCRVVHVNLIRFVFWQNVMWCICVCLQLMLRIWRP